jgi:ribosome maturation factor RimP
MSTTDRVRELVEPVVADLGIELVDVELTGGTLRVTVDRQGGLDLDVIATATRAVSRLLDEHDPVPGRYTLEVSSPGLERRLRTPDHFVRAIGAEVTVKTRTEIDGERRFRGTLVAADDAGITVRLADDAGDAGERTLAHDQIEKARTVFDWGPAPKPGRSKRSPARNQRKKASAR